MAGHKVLLSGCLVVSGLVVGARGATINYDFEDGTLDGWTNVRTNTINVPPKADTFQPWQNVTPHSNDSNSPSTLDGTGASGVWQVAPHVATFSGDSCCAQDQQPQTLVLTSPTFYFTDPSTASISFALTGGQGGAATPATGNFNTLPTATSGAGFEGVALRNTVTGVYILSATKDVNGELYEQLGFSNAQLSSVGALVPGTELQLDLINNFSGGWGWVAMDNVTLTGVPEPTTGAMMLIGATSLIGMRRRK